MRHCKATDLLSIGIAVYGLLAAGSLHANNAVSSTFDGGTEGWLVVDLPSPDPGAPPLVQRSYMPAYNPEGGDPGGYISMPDPSSGPIFYWSAPAKFLGDRSDAYGQTLSFDLASVGGNLYYNQDDIFLVSADMTLAYNMHADPGPTFTHFEIALTPSGWFVGSTSNGTPASATQMREVLGSVHAFYIRGEYLDGTDEVGYLDNVILQSSLPNDVIFLDGFD